MHDVKQYHLQNTQTCSSTVPCLLTPQTVTANANNNTSFFVHYNLYTYKTLNISPRMLDNPYNS